MTLTDEEIARLDKIVHERTFQSDADRTSVLAWAVEALLNEHLAAALERVEAVLRAGTDRAIPVDPLEAAIRQGDERSWWARELRAALANAIEEDGP